jgi:ketol-acid reductoisomerase
VRIVTEKDIAGEPLCGRAVAVIGFGNQGEAHALNLRDSGVTVAVGLRTGSQSAARARDLGLDVHSVEEACRVGDVIALMIPDEFMRDVFAAGIESSLKGGATLLFAHGFAVRFGGLSVPDGVDAVMVAPMGPGQRLRELYEQGTGLPASIAIASDASGGARRTALEYAKALGCARIGVFETSFAEEAEIDLFSEQAVLCGGVTRLITAAFDTLTEAGYSPELAYVECLYELKLTVDLIHRYGIAGMRDRISSTALFGDLTRGDRVIGESVRSGMREVLDEVRSGEFAESWMADVDDGHAVLRKRLREESGRRIEHVGRKLARILHRS